ncbi:MAB_1171c family putative transporter [Streptomyces sp. NPDC059862]|uniref:MAB_1171c family putative transporter n=1 Tax=Streptomyces sp. NPDC059862 TaxID=3346975 RepID=UPI003659ECD2
MSDSLVTIIYLLMAAAFLFLAAWKGIAFRREPTSTLALMTANLTVAGATYVLASPLGYTTTGSAFGQGWFATLPIYVAILLCFGLSQLQTIIWTSTRRDGSHSARTALVGWSAAYALAIVVMTVAFLSADLSGPADPLKFNTEQADEPFVLAFLAVFLTMLTCGTLHTWSRSRRARPDDEGIAHALVWFGRSMVIVFGYVTCSAPAIVAAAMGHHQLDSVGVLGSAFGVVGCIGICYAMSGAAVSVWLRERRDILALEPLWDLVVASVDERLAFSGSARPNRVLNVRFSLHRRIIEILDGIRALRPWMTDEAAKALEGLHSEALRDESVRERVGLGERGLSAQELEAAVTAAVLQHAVGRLQDARTQSGDGADATPSPHRAVYTLPGQATAADEERTRLIRVAAALATPLVRTSMHGLQGPSADGELPSRADAEAR